MIWTVWSLSLRTSLTTQVPCLTSLTAPFAPRGQRLSLNKHVKILDLLKLWWGKKSRSLEKMEVRQERIFAFFTNTKSFFLVCQKNVLV